MPYKKKNIKKKKESIFIQGVCVVCNKNKQLVKGICKNTLNFGKKIYKNTCTKCSMKNNEIRKAKNKIRIKCK